MINLLCVAISLDRFFKDILSFISQAAEQFEKFVLMTFGDYPLLVQLFQFKICVYLAMYGIFLLILHITGYLTKKAIRITLVILILGFLITYYG